MNKIMAINYRQEVRRMLIELSNSLCSNCRQDKKVLRNFNKIFERVLYKKRKNDK